MQDRLAVKALSTNESGMVNLKWCNSSTHADEDANMNFLDDVWGASLPSASAPKAPKRALDDGSEDESDPKKVKGSSGDDGSNSQPQPKEAKAKAKSSAARSGQTSEATRIRTLNGCDSLALEASQTLELLAGDDTVKSVGIASVTKLLDKIAAKLTPESISFLTSNWEAGQPLNRGCTVVEKMKNLQESLNLALPVVQSLQSKNDGQDT